MRFEITLAAREDLSRVVTFYNSKPGRYGSAFKASFREASHTIRQFPRRCPPVDDVLSGFEVREFLIDRFGQRVIFEVTAEVVRVLAIVHASRMPGSWHGRLQPPEEGRA